jgi:hypothetical protein
MGVAQEQDGTYKFVGDLDYPRTTRNAEGTHEHLPARFGWEWNGRNSDKRYPLLMSEYAVQTGHTLAEQQGMSVIEVPAVMTDSAPHLLSFGVDIYAKPSLGTLLGQTPEGARVLLLTGGYLPPHMTIVFTANADGTSSIAVDGGTDSSCYQYTKPFEDALGSVLNDVSTLDTAHALVGDSLVHIHR